jgi:Cu+-exporting ATPase
MLTGESMPVEKATGAQVIGGTLNQSGAFRFRATSIGAETALAQIIRLVEEAQGSSAKVQRLADQVTRVFVPSVVGVAFLAFAGWWAAGDFPQALLAFVAVLIIACPCALGIATPAALMVGVGNAAEAGILIRGAEVLERAPLDTGVRQTSTLARYYALTDVAVERRCGASAAARAVEVGGAPLRRAIVQGAMRRSIAAPAVIG